MKKRTFKTLIIISIILTPLAFFIKTFIFDSYIVQGTSMEPFIHDGQRIYCSKLAYGLCKPFGDSLIVQWESPKKGDIVIYLLDDNVIVKRCVATEGEMLEYSTESSYNLHIGDNSFPLTEIQYHLMNQSFQVPKDTILCIGDNYLSSIDSRNYGFVPVKNVIGKIVCK